MRRSGSEPVLGVFKEREEYVCLNPISVQRNSSLFLSQFFQCCESEYPAEKENF